MANEKRTLIYELLVEAKGAGNAKGELDTFGKALGELGGIAKGAFGVLAAGFALHGIAEAVDEMTKFNQVMAGLGVTGKEASDGLKAVQDIALTTMNAMGGVTEVYKEAVHLQEQMGRSAEDAGRTTEAFIRIANSEGRSAQSAAEQIKALGFALERGSIPAKEFIRMMKESPAFAQAAADALGVTTQQLAEMAKQGDIGAEAITRMVIQLEKIGADKETSATLGGITEALKTMATTAIQAFAKGAGFDAIVDPDTLATLKLIMDNVRGFFTELGGMIRIASNALQEMFNVAALIINVALNPFKAKEAWAHYNEEVMRDLADMKKGAEAFHEGLVTGTTSDPNYDPVNIAKKKAEQAAADAAAIEKGHFADMTAALNKGWDEYMKHHAEEVKKEQEARIKAMEETERRGIQLAKEALEEKQKLSEAAHRTFVENMREQDKDLKKQIEQGMDPGKLQAAIEELTNKSVPKFEFTMIDSLTAIEGATSTLQDAFTSLFEGGIHNAREFFQTILKGLANVFAQMAANQLVSNIMGAFKGAMQTQSIADVMAQGPVHARGAVFNAGAPVPFMQGGVIGGPTVFPMASGAVGLMGEAGPEAIMPLKRMGDGKLGVAAGLPNIQIVNNTGVQANASAQMKGDRMSIVLEAAQLGASMAEQRFNRSLRTGYGPAAKSMQTVYNLRRNV